MILEYTVSVEDEGKTVKQVIASRFSLSSRLLSKLKNTNGIKVNGVSVTVRRVLTCKELLTLEVTDESSPNVTASNIELDVLYEDDDILLVNKPLGMPTHPSQGHHDDTLANAVMYRYRNQSFTFRAITRLDGDTTGVVLVARNPLSAQRLTDMLQKGEIHKEYTALTVGTPSEREGVIDAPIARCEDSIIKRRIHDGGKNALTKYSVISTNADKTMALVKAIPVTGRTHQIRLHLSHIGTPIYGDFLYGEPIDGVRAYLHCSSLTFRHPSTSEKLRVDATLPDDIQQLTADFV